MLLYNQVRSEVCVSGMKCGLFLQSQEEARKGIHYREGRRGRGRSDRQHLRCDYILKNTVTVYNTAK